MSARTGDRLDPALLRRLAGEWLASRATEAILVTTLDDRGRPHPALLAYGEVVALTPTRIRLAVADASTTARNLRLRHARVGRPRRGPAPRRGERRRGLTLAATRESS